MPRRKLQVAEAFSGLSGPQIYKLGQFFSNDAHHSHYPWLGTPLINYRDKFPQGKTKKEYKQQILQKIQEGQTLDVAVASTAPPLVGAKAPKAQITQNKILATNSAMAGPTLKGASRFNKMAAYPVKGKAKTATNRKNKKPYPTKKVSKTPVKALEVKVKALQKAVNVDKAIHTYKQSECSTLKSLAGRCNHTAINGIATTLLESACTNLRFYDPSAPATLITANQNTGTFARDIYFKSHHTKLVIRNNYQVPAKIKVYLCKVKNDQNNSPLPTYIAAIADQVITGSADETDQLLYLNDIERVKEYWTVDCVLDKTLEPSQEASTSNTVNDIRFDPANIDEDAAYFQQQFKCYVYIVRLEGVLGHDNAVATEQSLLPAGIDMMIYRKAVIEYDAGVALNDIYIQEDRIQTFTNGGTTGGVCSLKPISDNLAYSVG